MQKPKFIKIAYTISTVLFFLDILFKTIITLNPQIALNITGYPRSELLKTPLNTNAVYILILYGLLDSVFLIICLINLFPKNTSSNRSLSSLIISAVFIPILDFSSNYIYPLVLKYTTSDSNAFILVSLISNAQKIVGYLHTYGLLVLFCTASVELYIAKNNKQT